jgi:hypothetical protein
LVVNRYSAPIPPDAIIVRDASIACTAPVTRSAAYAPRIFVGP